MKRYIIFIIIFSSITNILVARPVKVSFTGDIIMHIPVKNCAKNNNIINSRTKKTRNNEGFDFLFKRIRSHFKKSHIVVGNMEFPISPPFESAPKVFNCQPHVLPAMKKAGFTMMHLANNHINDQGIEGINNTINLVAQSKLDFLGVHRSETKRRNGIIKKIKGIKIGFIGYTGLINEGLPAKLKRKHLNWLYDTKEVIEDIKTIRKKCDYLIMIVHSGFEYVVTPNNTDKQILKNYLDQGVDLVVRHHPHILQPVEKYITSDNRKTYIFYSLGNFISNQSGLIQINEYEAISTRDSIILDLHLVKDSGIIKCWFNITPIYTRNVFNNKTYTREIQTVAIEDEIKYLNQLYLTSSDFEKKNISKKIRELTYKIKMINRVLFLKEKPGNINISLERN